MLVALQYTCPICQEDREQDDFPKASITSSCFHPLTDMCKECIRRYISSELSQRGTASLACPMCRETMSHDDVNRNAAREDFVRYDERAAIELMEHDPLFRWCPNPGCGAGQIQAYGDAEPKATCVRCRQPFCFIHRVRWHGGLTCCQFDANPELAEKIRAAKEAVTRAQKLANRKSALMIIEKEAKERRKRAAEERLGEAFVKANSKRCPGCDWSTQKIDGCKHMTCTSTTKVLCCDYPTNQ